MKVSKKDLCLLIALIGILVGVAGYYLIFTPTREKTEVIKAENTVLEKQVDELVRKGTMKDVFIEETQRMKDEVEGIYQLFPVDVREEDAIMLAINQEMLSPMSIKSVNISPMNEKDFQEQAAANASRNTTLEEDVNTAIEGGVGTTDEEGYEVPKATLADIGPLNCRQCAITYQVAYDGLKKSINNIMSQSSRMTIDSIAVSFDNTTGLLEGSTVVNMYCIPNQEGKEYVEPNMAGVVLGTNNIFGTKQYLVPTEAENDGESDDEDDEADSEE